MKVPLLLALLLVITWGQTYLLLSHPYTTTIVDPPGQTVGIEPYHTVFHPNWQGSGADWIFNDASVGWPHGYTATFEALFYADCLKDATLRITADNAFRAWLNDVHIGSGNNWNKNYVIDIKLLCGKNNLTVLVRNDHSGSPAGLVFTVVQNQADCYNCKGALSFYNRETCQCECVNECECEKPLTWLGYPTCGCGCEKSLKCSIPQYFNKQTCECECPQKHCPGAAYQDPVTCECVGTCASFAPCPLGETWDSILCKCVAPVRQAPCQTFTTCIRGQIVDPLTCQCVDALSIDCSGVVCAAIYSVDPVTCACVCPAAIRQECQAPRKLNEATCQCESQLQCQLACRQGWSPDYEQCQCVPPVACGIRCASNQIADFEKCECRCADILVKECTAPASLDLNTCVCTPSPIQCRLGCPRPKVLHPSECRCICPLTISRDCRPGYAFNDNTCRCERLLVQPPIIVAPPPICELGCREPFELNVEQCRCYCPETVDNSCQFPQVWNQAECRCKQFQIGDISI